MTELNSPPTPSTPKPSKVASTKHNDTQSASTAGLSLNGPAHFHHLDSPGFYRHLDQFEKKSRRRYGHASSKSDMQRPNRDGVGETGDKSERAPDEDVVDKQTLFTKTEMDKYTKIFKEVDQYRLAEEYLEQ